MSIPAAADQDEWEPKALQLLDACVDDINAFMQHAGSFTPLQRHTNELEAHLRSLGGSGTRKLEAVLR